MVEAEREVAAPPPNTQAEAEASASRGPLPPQGLTPTVIDLTSDDPPSNKGNRRRTSRWLMPRIGPEHLRCQTVTR
jgi:hypothetical protein